MIDELSVRIGAEKTRDLLSRLQSKEVTQVLPAEMELGILWGLHRLGEVEVEPNWWEGTSRPDAYSSALLAGRNVAIEIAAPNDNSISAEGPMDRVAQAISACADRVLKGVGERLYFKFGETSGYQSGVYRRKVLVPKKFAVCAAHEALIRNWIKSGRYTKADLAIRTPELHLDIEFRKHRQIRFHNIWTSMPPETHSATDNPLYQLLRRKASQLKRTKAGVLRVILLADAGSTLLNRLGSVGEVDPTRRRVSGREIISKFVEDNPNKVDAVVVFSPRREQLSMGLRANPRWAVFVFVREEIDGFLSGLDKLAKQLPLPRFEGYQARSLFRQGAYDTSANGWYLGLHYKGGIGMNGKSEVSISARLLLDLLAGRISEQQFRYYLGDKPDKPSMFKNWLDRGKTISDVTMKPRSLDEDDDHIGLHFSDDAAARALRSPEQS